MMQAIHPRTALSGRFVLSDFTHSKTAKKLGLYNLPREASEVANLIALCAQILDPIECRLKGRLRILSGYRTVTLNRLLGGARDSQHLLGEAADVTLEGVPATDAAFTISQQGDLPFDRLVLMHRRAPDGGITSALHLSHRRLGQNRRQVETRFIDAAGVKVQAGIQAAENFLMDQAA